MGRLLPAAMAIVLAVAARGELPEPKDPGALIDYIKSAEVVEIRESWAEQAGQCFTWADYAAFVRDRRAAAVAERMKAMPQFQKLATLIGALPPADRDRLLARGRESARPAWAMIARISTAGTTDAGRRAGLDLANAIFDLWNADASGETGRLSNDIQAQAMTHDVVWVLVDKRPSSRVPHVDAEPARCRARPAVFRRRIRATVGRRKHARCWPTATSAVRCFATDRALFKGGNNS